MKIALIGYGKMGHIIEAIALNRGHEIVCIIDKDNTNDFSSAAFASADVAIEFTTPHTAEQNILRAWEAGVPVVCGTTGWNVENGKQKERTSRQEEVKKAGYGIEELVKFYEDI